AALHVQSPRPIAAVTGGGEAGAAGARSALNRLWVSPLPPEALAERGLKLGADVPACLAGRPVWVGGIGGDIEMAPHLPPLGLVLANPRHPLTTSPVFRARCGAFSRPGRFETAPQDPPPLARTRASPPN